MPVRAHARGLATAQAASLYLFAYYAGSSVFGSASGWAWGYAGWPAVVALTGALFAGVAVLSAVLHRTRSLLPPRIEPTPGP